MESAEVDPIMALMIGFCIEASLKLSVKVAVSPTFKWALSLLILTMGGVLSIVHAFEEEVMADTLPTVSVWRTCTAPWA